jgi:hypothetical protein
MVKQLWLEAVFDILSFERSVGRSLGMVDVVLVEHE